MNVDYLWMFPFSIIIASFATTVGVGGPIFFSPIFMLIFNFDPVESFGTALVIQTFGFASGGYKYSRLKQIDFRLSGILLLSSIPCAVIGAFLSQRFDYVILEIIFSLWVIVSGLLLFNKADAEIYNIETEINRVYGILASALGGFLVGLLSTGYGSIIIPWMNIYGKIPIKKTVATSVFVIFCTVLFSSLIYLFFDKVRLEMLLYTVPGVIIGGQIGPVISKKINPVKFKIALSLVFMAAGIIMLVDVLLHRIGQ